MDIAETLGTQFRTKTLPPPPNKSKKKTKQNKAKIKPQKSKNKQTDKNKTQKNRWTIRTTLKLHERTQMLTNGKQFLPLIRHPPSHSYSQDVLNTTTRRQTVFDIYCLVKTTFMIRINLTLIHHVCKIDVTEILVSEMFFLQCVTKGMFLRLYYKWSITCNENLDI